MAKFTEEVVVRFIADTKDSERSIGKLLNVTSSLNKGVQTVTKTYKTHSGALHSVTKKTALTNTQMEKLDVTMETNRKHMKDYNKGLFQTGESFGRIIGKVAQWTLATGAVFGTLRGIQKSVGIMKDFESQMVSLRKVFQGSSYDLGILQRDILNLSVSMGSLTAETGKAAIELGRMGKTQKEISELMRVSLLAQNIAELDTAEATKLLNAAVMQFNLTADDAIAVLDKWNELSNRTPVETKALAEAMSIAGAVVHQAGGELEDLNAWTATLTETMAKSGREIGNAIKTIASYAYRQQTMKKITELTGIAVQDQMGNLMDIDDLLSRLSVQWKNLTEAEREELAMSVAGVRRKPFFLNLMEKFNLVLENQAVQWQAAGSSMRENEIRLESLATKLKQLTAAFEALAIDTGENTGLLKGLKAITDSLREMIEHLRVANGALQLLAGVGSVVAVAALNKILISLTAASVAANKFTGVMLFLNKALLKWTIAIGVAVTAFNLLIRLFTISERRSKREIENINKMIDVFKKQRSAQESIIDAYETYNSIYEEYVKLKKEGEDTAEVEERLATIMDAMKDILPGLIDDTDDYATALEKLGDAADTAAEKHQKLTKDIMVREMLKAQKELEKITKELIAIQLEALEGLYPRVKTRETQPGRRGYSSNLTDKEKKAMEEQQNNYKELEAIVDDVGKLEARRDELLAQENVELDEEVLYLQNIIDMLKTIEKLEADILALREGLGDVKDPRDKEEDRAKEKYTLTDEQKEERKKWEKERLRHEMSMAQMRGEGFVVKLLKERIALETDSVLKYKYVNQLLEMQEKIQKRIRDGEQKTNTTISDTIIKMKEAYENEQLRTLEKEEQLQILEKRLAAQHARKREEQDLVEMFRLQLEIMMLMLEIDKDLRESATKRAKETQRNWERAFENVAKSFSRSISDAMVLGITDGATRSEKNQVWNRMVSKIGDDIGNAVGSAISSSIIPTEGATMGQIVSGTLKGGLASGAIATVFGLLGQALFPTKEPVDPLLDATEDNTRSIQELTDTMKSFLERYINAPSTFALGATSGEIPQAAGGGKMMNDGYVYAHAGEYIGSPEQLLQLPSGNRTTIENNFEIHASPGQSEEAIADIVVTKISQTYRTGEQYHSKI